MLCASDTACTNKQLVFFTNKCSCFSRITAACRGIRQRQPVTARHRHRGCADEPERVWPGVFTRHLPGRCRRVVVAGAARRSGKSAALPPPPENQVYAPSPLQAQWRSVVKIHV